MRPRLPPLIKLFLAASILLCIPLLIQWSHGRPLIPEGPALRQYEVARNLIDHGSFTPEKLYTLHHDLMQRSRIEQSGFWQDTYSIRPGGDLFPLHSVVPPLLLAPLLLIFGDLGVVLLNIGVLAALIAAIYRVALELRPDIPWTVGLFGAVLGSQIPFYTGGIAYDSLGALFIVGGFAIAFRHPAIGGALVGASCFIRPTNALYVPLLMWGLPRDNLIRFMLGSITSGTLWCVSNALLWGGPLTSAYHRTPTIINGEAVFIFTSLFSFASFLEGWDQKLFGLTNGLLLFNPIIFLTPLAWWLHRRHQLANALAATFIIQSFLMFSYSYWNTTIGGNRYLMPAVCLAIALCLPVVYAIAQGYARLKARLTSSRQ